MALSFNLSRGTSYPFQYQHTDGTGANKSLVGCKLYLTIKPSLYDDDVNDSTAIIKKTITTHVDQNGVASAAAGLSYFALTDAETYYSAADGSPIEPGKYFWSLLVENANGQTDPPSDFGTVTIKATTGNRQVVNG